MPSSANKQSASKPGPIKASRDILPVNKANEEAFLASSKDPRGKRGKGGKDMLSDLKSVDSEEELSEEEQMRMIQDQFQSLYDYDPDIRKLIPMEEVKKMSLEDKYHVITAYMRGGGIRGLVGDDDDTGDLSPEEQRMVEEEFLKLYHEEPRFKMIIGDTKPSAIPLRDKYELVLAYSKRGPGLPSDTDSDTPIVEGEFVTYRGKKFKRVRIDNSRDGEPNDDEEEEYLMDEQGNIYDTKFRLIGRADDDEEEDHNYEDMMKMMGKGDESNEYLEDFDMAKFEKDLSKRLDDKHQKPFGLEDDDYQDDFDEDEFNL
jgi:hypothetical protein